MGQRHRAGWGGQERSPQAFQISIKHYSDLPEARAGQQARQEEVSKGAEAWREEKRVTSNPKN